MDFCETCRDRSEIEERLFDRDSRSESVQYIQVNGSMKRIEGLAVARFSLMFTMERLVRALDKVNFRVDEFLCKELKEYGLDEVEVSLCLGRLNEFREWMNSRQKRTEPKRYVPYPPEPGESWDF